MPDFSRKHYKKVAEIISLSRDKEFLFTAFSELFAEDNPLFDKEKFAIACGM